ncbi:zinc transporter ZitB [Devosia geojensis]|uniref:Zinc transporter ZitB n=1 Tax=Devosia geojensis TaxID=443610 RepID=A0A0F5FX66_9HYPH|nr:cation diffusion facilitator family transporter [Devosia geojensis]KKB13140.1 zinc transporter ZitB [Devosia geojensis]
MTQHEAHDHSHDHGDHQHDHTGHDHSHAPTVTAGNERVVLIGFALTFGFMIAEVIGGLLSGSLALIADAGHMLTDAIALALAWAGFRFGRRPSDRKRTFGYMRLEVLAGFVNAVSLFALVAWIAWEAVGRLFDPHPILTGPMFTVAVIGLAVNVVVFLVLRQGDTEHVNIKGAMLHVVGDLLGSVAAIVAAIAIYFTGWTPIDPILSVLLSLLILRSAWSLFKNSLQILIEGAPSGIDVEGMPEALADAVPGVAGVEHVHVWSITSGQPAATMEVRLVPGADARETLKAVKAALADKYGIGHSTIEIDFGDTGADCSLRASAGKGHTH